MSTRSRGSRGDADSLEHAAGARLAELDSSREIVLHCHHGQRSMRALDGAIARFRKLKNLRGGIDAWSREVDPDSRY